MTYSTCEAPLRWGSHLPLANLLKWKGKYPSYNFLQAVHSLTDFQQERRRWTLANWKQDLLRLSKTFLSIKMLLKSCNLSWDLRGIYRPQEDSNFGLQNLNSLRVPGAGGSTAQPGGATAQRSGAGRCNRPAKEVSPPSSRVLGGATAQLGGATAYSVLSPTTVFAARLQCFQPLVGLQSWLSSSLV